MFILLNAFYLAQVGEYHTGILDTTTLFDLGIIEIHYAIITLFLITAFFGGGVWEFVLLGIKLKKILIFAALLATLFNFKLVYENCMKVSTRRRFIHSVIPYFSIIICTGVLFSNPLIKRHQDLVFFSINFIYNQNCMKIIISAMAKMKFNILQQEVALLFTFLFLVLIYWNNERIIGVVSILFFCLSASNLVFFWSKAVRDIARYLDIPILTVG